MLGFFINKYFVLFSYFIYLQYFHLYFQSFKKLFVGYFAQSQDNKQRLLKNNLTLYFRVLSNSSPVTVLQWDFTGELLLVADESGCVRIYSTKDHILNEWSIVLQTVLQGEHILAAAFFHSGKRVLLIKYINLQSYSSNNKLML